MNLRGEKKIVAPMVSKSRYQWMDMTRGLAILAVMIFHSGSYLIDQGYSVDGSISEFYSYLAPFRMPLLIFLSGILLDKSLSKGLSKFVYGKVKNILWPYAIWLAIFCLAAGRPEFYFTQLAWGGGTWLWYMFFLMIFYAITPVLIRIPYIVIAFYAVVLSMFVEPNTKYQERILILMSFFYLGAFVGQYINVFERLLSNVWVFAVFPIILFFAIYASEINEGRYAYSNFVVVCGAIVLICGFFNKFSSKYLSIFSYIGKNSIVFYLTHMPIIFIISKLIVNNGFSDVGYIIVINFTVSLCVAFLFCALKSNVFIKALFEAPDIVSFDISTRFGKIAQAIDRLPVLPRRFKTEPSESVGRD